MTVSVCLPARDEQETVGAIVEAVVTDLVKGSGLVDEVVVIDDGSGDATAEVAAAAGAKVFSVDEILPEMGSGTGKGEALWKALYVTEGEILVFLDADLRDFDTRWVSELATPLLLDGSLNLVKANYQRDLGGAANEGGRVNELVARPLIELFFPTLARIGQPLGGEFAARRSAVEQLPFATGYGVDLGLLVDVAETFGEHTVAQAEMSARTHRNRPLDDLRHQATTVMRTALERAGVPVAPGLAPVVASRPPMVRVDSYRLRFPR